jgi:hypothetical protein
MQIPTKEEIAQLQEEFDILPVINEHLKACERKALEIAEKILKSGKVKELDFELIKLGAQLHDLAKAATIEELAPEKFGFPPATEAQIKKWKAVRKKYPTKGHELEVMAEIMREKGYDKFAGFLLTLGWPQNPGYLTGTLESKIIHYADWTLEGVKDIPFKDKVEYERETYGKKYGDKSEQEWEVWKQNEYEFEKYMLDLMGEGKEN